MSCYAASVVAAFLGLGCVRGAAADFVYDAFSSTHGLTFLGTAGTTSCIPLPDLEYGPVQGLADGVNGTLPVQVQEEAGYVVTKRYETDYGVGDGDEQVAGFGHRGDALGSPDSRGEECDVRLRLTPSFPSKAGAVWRSSPVRVLRGFETLFTFQVTDQSKVCSERLDPLFSSALHKTCAVNGGDGLAFVLHSDPRGIEAIGETGAGMGYSGIESSLAVELDTHYNPGADSTDLIYDHVALHSRGRGAKNEWTAAGELSLPVSHSIADGQVHLVRIRYFPHVEMRYMAHFQASPEAIPFIVDNGESRRVGSLVVWMDEGIASDEPLFAVPINLSVLLDASDLITVGFVASTGRSWAKHDILSWIFCHEDDECVDAQKAEWNTFDHHLQTLLTNSRYVMYTPGKGFGAGGGEYFRGATKHQSPNTDPWKAPQTHFSNERTEGISSTSQIPPSTENRYLV
jgi:hypothetical protein